jgi:ABC-type dipeptide/oligopeptide/nickel transport system permease subunit
MSTTDRYVGGSPDAPAPRVPDRDEASIVGPALAVDPLSAERTDVILAPRQRRRLRAFMKNRLAVAAAVFLLLVVALALLANVVATADPTRTDLLHRYALPNGAHLFGTDSLGRDVFSRLLFATRISMVASVASVGGALIIAAPVGLVAGYFGGKINAVVVFLVDIILSVPPLILVFATAGILGPSLQNAIVALMIYFTPMYIRLIRVETLRIRHSQLAEAEIALGVRDRSILVRHVLPNIAPSLVVQVALTLGVALLAEASLSFLGIGVVPPTASWGVMLREAFDHMTAHPGLLIAPAAAIALTVVAWNLLADGLRDALGRVEG